MSFDVILQTTTSKNIYVSPLVARAHLEIMMKVRTILCGHVCCDQAATWHVCDVTALSSPHRVARLSGQLRMMKNDTITSLRCIYTLLFCNQNNL